MIDQLQSKFGLSDAKTCSVPIDPHVDLHVLPGRDDREFQAVPHVPYEEIVGSLLHSCNTTRPDISFVCSLLSRYLRDPRRCHWNAARSVLRYLKKTRDLRIVYGSHVDRKEHYLHGHSDAYYAGDRMERKLTSDHVFKYFHAAISWRSKKQTIVTRSSCESEYVSMSFALREAIWLGRLFKDDFGIINHDSKESIMLFADNQGAMKMAPKDSVNERSKHVEVKNNFIRHHVQTGNVKLEFLSTDGAGS